MDQESKSATSAPELSSPKKTEVAVDQKKGKKKCPKPDKLFIGCIFMGQLMSFMCVVPGVFTTYLAYMHISIPFFQAMMLYSIFTLFWVIPNVHRFLVHKKMDVLLYIIIGILDVTQNTLGFTAYNYTSVAAVLLLFNLSIPAALIFSFLIRKNKFSWLQVVMAILCTASAAIFTYIDNMHGLSSGGVLGDILACFAGIVIGLESVVNEYVTGRYNPYQWLARMSVSALVVATILFCALELDTVMATGVLGEKLVWGYLMGYEISMLLYYMIVPWLIGHSNAMVFNVSFITSNIFSFLSSYFLFHQTFPNLIWLPVVLILISLIGYFAAPTSPYCCSVRPKSERNKAAAKPMIKPIKADLPETPGYAESISDSSRYVSGSLNDVSTV